MPTEGVVLSRYNVFELFVTVFDSCFLFLKLFCDVWEMVLVVYEDCLKDLGCFCLCFVGIWGFVVLGVFKIC